MRKRDARTRARHRREWVVGVVYGVALYVVLVGVDVWVNR